jgi:hypothetical protein
MSDAGGSLIDPVPSGAPGPIVVCAMMWAHDGQVDALRAYEAAVIPLIGEHGGELLQRLACDGIGEQPHEINVFQFPDRAALEAYMSDPRREALSADRDAAIRRTEVIPVRPI